MSLEVVFIFNGFSLVKCCYLPSSTRMIIICRCLSLLLYDLVLFFYMLVLWWWVSIFFWCCWKVGVCGWKCWLFKMVLLGGCIMTNCTYFWVFSSCWCVALVAFGIVLCFFQLLLRYWQWENSSIFFPLSCFFERCYFLLKKWVWKWFCIAAWQVVIASEF